MIGNNIKYIFISVGLIIIGLFVSITILLFAFQSKLIYFPYREIIMTPEQVGLSYRTVFFKSIDGIKLTGWFIPAEKSKGVILFCHGNGGNISHRIDSIQIFNSLGFSVFIFDYQGYGLSEGKPSEQGTYLDASAAWEYLIQKEKSLRV